MLRMNVRSRSEGSFLIKSPMIDPGLIKLVSRDAQLVASPIHGLYHWRTVERNGLYLAEHTECDAEVIHCFAYLHDSMRFSEGRDLDHGARAADYARYHRSALGLNGAQLDLLCEACTAHTAGTETTCPTVAACWDADRLDLGRVGIIPDAKHLLTEEGKRIAREKDFQSLYGYGEVEKM